MTTFEMQQLFETLLQTSSPLFNDSEKPDTDTIFRFLNEAQIQYISKKYLSAASFEERTRAIGNNLHDLRNLIKTIDLSNVVTAPRTNTLLFKSTTINVWHYLGVSGIISRTYPQVVTTTLIDLIPIEAGDVNKYLTTAINKPVIYVPVYTQTASTSADAGNYLSIMVIHDAYTTYSTTASTTKAHCLVAPKLLDLADSATTTATCELAEYLHEDIVKLAVSLFEEQKYKLSKSKEDK